MKYRKKPVVIDAVQWDGTNVEEVIAFGEGAIKSPLYFRPTASLLIETLEGDMCANLNDWIIRGIKGEFYPCKPDIFAATYEVA